MKRFLFGLVLFLLCTLFFGLMDLSLAAAAETSSGGSGYLAAYQETDPHPSQASWWSTLAYLLSLLVVFLFVLVLAYLASRFLGGRFARPVTEGGGRILESLALGPNRSVCVVELGGKVLLLGVAEQSITLLQEITDAGEIDRLHHQSELAPAAGTESLFSQQLQSLDKLSQRIPGFFKDRRYRK